MRTILISGLAFCLVGLAASACGGDSYGASTPAPTGPSGPGSTGAAAVKIASTRKGNVLADGSSMTLYTFDQDKVGSGASACTGSCAGTWPAATAPDGVLAKPAGLSGDLGTIMRDDGHRQLTYAGRPLYRYSGDHAAGDLSGDGVGGVWHIALAGPGAAAPTSAGSSSYYGSY